jgi:hypothetical protein
MGITRHLATTLLALALALAAGAAAAPAPPPAPATRELLDNLIQAEHQVDLGGFGAILVTARGPAWSYVGGDGGLIPFRLDTPLMAGELSGRMVILAASRLADRGLLAFHRPLGSCLPGLAAKGVPGGHLAAVARLPVGAVAAETTGRVDLIPRLVPDYRPERDLLPALDARAPRFAPGCLQSWSCGMNDLLALALERTRRRPWPRLVAAEALRPAGMAGSAFLTADQAARTVRFYHPDGAPYDPRLVVGLLPALAPSLSLRTTLGDLGSLASAMLAGYAGAPGAPLSRRLVRTALAPAIPGQLDRQGYETGLGWNLTDYRLAYLGRVAWAYGSAITHQTLVVLLPDRGIGAVLAQTWYDPAALYDLKRIARALLETWAERDLGLPRPVFQVPATIPPVPEPARPVPGLYASEAGLAEVGWDGDLVTLTARGGYGTFLWAGAGRFRPAEAGEFAQAEFAGDTLTVTWRSGARARLARVGPPDPALALEPGSWPVETPGSIQGRGVALVDLRQGHWIITGDDGRSYLLLAGPEAGARVLCDPSSALYGCRIHRDAQGAWHITAPAVPPPFPTFTGAPIQRMP